MQQNIQNNHFDNCILHNFGLSDTEKTETLFINPTNNGNSSFYKTNVRSRETHSALAEEKVSLRIGDEVINEETTAKIDLIKIDVEGHEAEALAGLKNTICQHKPFVLIEWNNKQTRNAFSEKNILDTLFLGYSIQPITTNYDDYRYSTKKDLFRALKHYLFKRTHKYYHYSMQSFDWDRDYNCILFFPEDRRTMVERLLSENKVSNNKYLQW